MTQIADLMDRLTRLATRREDEGIYTDAMIVSAAADRIAALEAQLAERDADNERLKLERDAANADRDRWYESSFRATQRAESLSRTGAVNEGGWRDISETDRQYFPHPDGSKIEVQVNDTGYRQRFTKVMTVGSPQWRMHLRYIVRWRECALEPAAPEGEQDVPAFECGSCGYTSDPDCPICTPPPRTRPSEQAVTEAWREITEEDQPPRDVPVLMGCWEKWPRDEWIVEYDLYGSTKGGWIHGRMTHWLPSSYLPSAPTLKAAMEAGR